MTTFDPLPRDLMIERLAPPSSGAPVRLLIDTDTANEIDDQYALAWALLSPESMTIEAVTAAPFSFAHHKPELLAAEGEIKSGKRSPEHLVGGLQGWIDRLHAQGRRASDLTFVEPAEGMELSYQEILKVFEMMKIDSTGRVFRGASC